MTKKTIMELLKETNKKAESEGRYYDMNRLFGHAMRDANDLSSESIEQHVAVHTLDTLERIANALEKELDEDETSNQGGQALTYLEFIKAFNALDQGYRAYESNRAGVDIVSNHGDLRASFYKGYNAWYFRKSSFYSNELMLMAQLAATPQELRGGKQ